MKDNRLTEMRVFKAVADSGGFTAASHVLGVSQPFVSQRINELEQRLGVKLLHRSTRMQKLTEEGLHFLAACNAILDDLNHAELQIRSSAPAGNLRISAALAFGLDQIVPILPEFMSAYPLVKVNLSLTDAHQNLIQDDIDVAIRMGRLQDSSLASRKLCRLQRILVAAPSYIDRHGRPVTPQGLVKHRCLSWNSPHDHLNRWPFIVNGRRIEMLVDGFFSSSNGSSLFEMCLAGVGVMRLAEHLALPAIRQNKLVPLLQEYQADDNAAIHVVFLPERRLVPRIRVFVDFCVNTFAVPPWRNRSFDIAETAYTFITPENK